MQPQLVNKNIQELEKTRKEAALWRIGGTVAALAIVVTCVSLLASSVNGLVRSGPQQDVYVAELRQGMDTEIVPRLQQVASQTLTEMQPVVETEFRQLNTRVPDLTKATMKEIETLQTSLPKKGEQVLDETFGAALKAQEPELRKMFPSATEEQVTTLMTNLGTMATTRGEKVANELLTPHTNRMRRIVTNLRAIEESEPASVEGNADWQLGLLVFDIVREDLKGLEPKMAKPAATVTQGAKK
ncbi:hypothetical protein EON81_15855 [bacterium]|nr:MAG: hypothetical protein EON81_15855 [bacterium]